MTKVGFIFFHIDHIVHVLYLYTNSVLTIAIIELLAWPWPHVVLSNRHSAAYLIHFLLPGDCIHGNCLSDGCIILRHSHQILHYVNICHRGACTEDFHFLLPFFDKDDDPYLGTYYGHKPQCHMINT